ncbi:hypothetical protein V8C37DRAFT_396819 [Trichoderma ceciliae]
MYSHYSSPSIATRGINFSMMIPITAATRLLRPCSLPIALLCLFVVLCFCIFIIGWIGILFVIS